MSSVQTTACSSALKGICESLSLAALAPEQPDRKLPSAGAPARTEDATVQVAQVSPALSLAAGPRPQRVQALAGSPVPIHASDFPVRGSASMETHDRCGLKPARLRPYWASITFP